VAATSDDKAIDQQQDDRVDDVPIVVLSSEVLAGVIPARRLPETASPFRWPSVRA
jgi:hypothetical protein